MFTPKKLFDTFSGLQKTLCMKKLSIILPFIAIVMCFATCKINRQDKLIGNWKLVPFTDPDSAVAVTYWTFYAGDLLEIYSLSTVDSTGKKPNVSNTDDQEESNVDESDNQADSVAATALKARKGTMRRGLNIGDTLSFASYSYNTDGKIVNILMPDLSADANYIPGSKDICGQYWMDEIKKNKRLKLVRRKDPKGEKGGAYLRMELVKVKK